MNESNLVAGCKQGDGNARRSLYECYARYLMGLCYRYTGNREAAEDLLHDGFILVFESIGKFEYRGDGSLKAWLIRIFTNLALECLRKNQQWEFVPVNDYCSIENPEEIETKTVSAEILMKHIAELPAGYRTVLNLFVFENKSHSEIAELLNISEGTSRSQFFRAKNLLAKRIRVSLQQV
ncbi:MAG: sigma-70 family RNA polymerase sigma factor [Dysgonamonadaceae bacterium]|jgi:RNA polymerase sigma-70 factor (ECF subfamily)|nr:sigma-70 family RNA polymerase sigma factor [Dysgonamonadaceae bacterium]